MTTSATLDAAPTRAAAIMNTLSVVQGWFDMHTLAVPRRPLYDWIVVVEFSISYPRLIPGCLDIAVYIVAIRHMQWSLPLSRKPWQPCSLLSRQQAESE